jgi:alpha-beta hydrolase superfamily lysophospholipase
MNTNMTINEYNWKVTDGTNIYAKSWTPEKPKGVVCTVHGLGEHINRYEHVATFFNKNGYALCGNDHYGHGKSGGTRGHTPSYEGLLVEVDTLIAKAKNDFPGLPIYLYGHSMGGNIVLNYLFKRNPKINGVIATGSAITLHENPPAALLAVGKIMRKIYPKFAQPNGLKLEFLSTDQAVIDAYVADELVHDRVTSELGLALIEQGNWLIETNRKTDIPLLLMHGAEDGITSPAGTVELSKITEGDVTLKLWKGMYHEIHNEIDKQEVLNFMLDWIKK